MCKGPGVLWGGTSTAAGAEDKDAGWGGRQETDQVGPYGPYYFGPYNIKGEIEGFKTGQ